MRARPFQTLEEAGQSSGRMYAHQQMEMGRDDPEFYHSTPLLPGDDGQVFLEIRGAYPIYTRFPSSGGPDDMEKEMVMHLPKFAAAQIVEGPNRRGPGRFSDTSRAVALATSNR